LIKIENLTFFYSDAEKPALKDVNLEIEDGEFVLITGPSGGGKSSLCRCFNGLIPHFYGGKLAGRVEVQGLDTKNCSPRELATRVGMIFQDPESQLVTMDAEREIAFGLENLGFSRTLITKRIEESLDTLSISHLRHRTLHDLSGGEKQKVAIASVLALHPEILVLDEPTSELDPNSAEEVLSMLERLNDELGITVILVEHRLDRVVQHIDRLVVLHRGRVVADGRAGDVFIQNYEELTEIGTGIPPIIKLAHELRKTGINMNGIPLTVKEGRISLRNALQKAYTRKLQDDEIGKNCVKPVIEVKKLWYAYPEGATALKDVNLRIGEGELAAVMGRNASGKTTLVKHFNGLLKPAKGKVLVDGIDTREATVAQLARAVGFVFQNPNDHLFADTVEKEIALTLENLGFESREIRVRVDKMLERFNLKEYRKQYPRSLSVGEKQRVALASVIVAEPKVLVLDEPTRGMDHKLKRELMKFLQEYTAQGNTVILVTHDVEIVAELAGRVVLLSEGKIMVDGHKRDVLSRSLLFSPQINRLVQAFQKYGIPDNILTVDELVRVVR